MKIVERKTNLEGTAVFNSENNTYEVVVDNKEAKTIAESTFKRNYKVIKEEEVVETQSEIAIDEEPVVELVEVEDNTENNEEVELVEVLEQPEVAEAKEEKAEKIEIVLTDEEIEEVKTVVENLRRVIEALPVSKVNIEKNGHNSKVILEEVGMTLMVDCKNSLMESIANELKELFAQQGVEVDFKNMQKRPNPAAFKARGVKVTGADGEEKTFKTRNDAMIWITNKYENNELLVKPTYYQVKKALENNLEYAGYKWEEIDPAQIITAEA